MAGGVQPRGAPDWPGPTHRGLAWQVLSMTSFALSLLMIFRTNSCYARWWEARTAWGLVVAAARNLVRQSAAWRAPSCIITVEQACDWRTLHRRICLASCRSIMQVSA